MSDIAVVVVSTARDTDNRSVERLTDALRSIATQTNRPASIHLVHEPAGADAAAHAAGDAKVSVEPVPATSGLAAAVNGAVASGKAPLLAFADGESVWAPRKLAAQSSAFVRPGLDLCGHREDLDRNGIKEVVGAFPAEAKWPPVLRALRRPLWSAGTTMMRRSAFDRLGGFRDGADFAQDFLLRAARGNVPQFLLEAPLTEVAADPGDWPQPLPELRAVGGAGNSALVRGHLAELSIEAVFGPSLSDAHAARLALGGAALLYDDLDGCHTAAQAVEEPTANFWHAVMHRREGDFENSKYWWRRAGTHPVFADVFAAAMPVLKAAVGRDAAEFRGKLERAGEWDAFAFTDLCRACVEKRASKATADLARRLQMLELNALLGFTVKKAMG
jgi:hypothetical protein